MTPNAIGSYLYVLWERNSYNFFSKMGESCILMMNLSSTEAQELSSFSLGFQDSCMWGKGSFCSVTSALALKSSLVEMSHVTKFYMWIGYQLALCELGVSQSLSLLNFQPPTQSLSKNMEEDLSNFPKMTFIQS